MNKQDLIAAAKRRNNGGYHVNDEKRSKLRNI
jgi:hypothetical protein